MMTMKNCLVLDASKLSRNGRKYDATELANEVIRLQDQVADGRLLGTFAESATDGDVSMSAVTHRITKLHCEDGVVTADVDLLDTPHGKIAQNLLESSVELSLSARGTGIVTLAEDDSLNVSEYRLITIDLTDKSIYD